MSEDTNVSVESLSTAPVATVDMWNGRLYFPKNKYILRLMTKEYKLSKKSNNPMIEFGWEICGKKAPDGSIVTTVNIKQADDSIVTAGIAGLGVSSWMMLTEANMGHVKEFHRLMKLPITEINPESPELSIYDRLIINAIISCEKREELSDDIDETTGKQISILDDEGKRIIKHFLKLNMGDITGRNLEYQPSGGW